MRLTFTTQALAQAKADAIHAWLIANNAAYAGSVAKGHTLRWAIPYQDRDRAGKVVGTSWYVNVKDRCLNALSAPERTAIVQSVTAPAER